jgi:NADPH:quinone reductase-like Zn-dependent oxidoreductase
VKAVRYTEHGDESVLRYSDVTDPEPGPADVLVAIAAASVNRLDLIQRAGPGLLPGYALPHIPGMDIAGTIVAVGADVDDARVGERVVLNPAIACGRCLWCERGGDDLCTSMMVVGASGDGGYAERCVVPATHALEIPDSVDFAEAATWPTAYSTAWHALFASGELRLGETVVIHGASSGVSSAAIQLAARAGATVIATARGEEKLDWAAKLGAHLTINSQRADIATAVREATDGRGADLVIDHVGPALFDASLRSLRPRGRLVFFGTTTGARVEMSLPSVYRTGLRLIGSENYSGAEYAAMIAHLSSASLPSIIDRELPLDAAGEAHRLLARGEVLGKLVLRP